ncbi:MAG: hypothetical protein RR389_01055 [Christensenella sp.]
MIPNINISFRTATANAIKRSDRGIVGLVVRGGTTSRLVCYTNANEIIASDMSAEDLTFIKNAFIGGERAPKAVVVAIIPAINDLNKTNIKDGLAMISSSDYKPNWIALPPNATKEDYNSLEAWIAIERDVFHNTVKAVAFKHAANCEAIVNLTNGMADLTARIAGLLAGTPVTSSISYALLSDVIVDAMTEENMDIAIAAHELIFIRTKAGARMSSGICSDGSKIRAVEIKDLLSDTIKDLLEEKRLGKLQNTYDGKRILISDIKSILTEFETEGLIDFGSVIDIDIVAQTVYLKSQGVATNELSDIQIREYNTGDKVFLYMQISINDVIEVINLVVNI